MTRRELNGRPADSLRDEPTIPELIEKREREARLLKETSDAELIEARDRTDAGVRLAMPEFMTKFGLPGEPPPPQPPVTAEDLKRTGSDLADIYAALVVVGKRFPLTDKQAHAHINAMLNQSRDLGAYLSERYGS